MTLRDVADLAGCSKATVSLVLNAKTGISEAMRKKVLAACGALGYGKLDIPGNEASARICIIDVVRDSFIAEPKLLEFKSYYVRGIQKRCDELNVGLETAVLYKLDTEELQSSLRQWDDLSGIIVLGSDLQSEEDFEMFSPIQMPIVFIDTFYTALGYNFINVDNRGGMMLLLNCLKSLGHREVGLISIDTINYNIRERERAFIEIAGSGKFITNDQWCFRFNMADENDLLSRIRDLISTNTLPSAVVCTTDLIPIQLFPILTAMGIDVPGRLSVVSFGDLSLSRFIRPRLTTIDPPKNQIGRAAVELIINQLDKANQPENLGYRLNPERVLVSNNLIVRESAAECPGAGHNRAGPSGNH